MNDTTKQRIVGAVVLVALGIIFIPMFLDFQEDHYMNEDESPIPERSGEFASITIPVEQWAEASLNEIIDEVPESENPDILPVNDVEPREIEAQVPSRSPEPVAAAGSVPAKTASPAPARATVEVDGKPAEEEVKPSLRREIARSEHPAMAWVVQVGSFSNEANALKLRDRLQKKGYDAFTESVRTDDKRVTRVRIGPELRRSRAEKIKSEIEKDLKLTAMILKYR